jgi:hypothetical protein
MNIRTKRTPRRRARDHVNGAEAFINWDQGQVTLRLSSRADNPQLTQLAARQHQAARAADPARRTRRSDRRSPVTVDRRRSRRSLSPNARADRTTARSRMPTRARRHGPTRRVSQSRAWNQTAAMDEVPRPAPRDGALEVVRGGGERGYGEGGEALEPVSTTPHLIPRAGADSPGADRPRLDRPATTAPDAQSLCPVIWRGRSASTGSVRGSALRLVHGQGLWATADERGTHASSNDPARGKRSSRC